jgi:hypothetical protein
MRQCGRPRRSKSSRFRIPLSVFSAGISGVSAFLPYVLGTITALLSLMIATSAFAQAAIQYPGVYAFYYPNASLGIESLQPRASVGAFAAMPRHRGYATGAYSHQKHIRR